MNVFDYCALVHQAVQLAQPEPYLIKHPACEDWLRDTSQAAVALRFAFDGDFEKALRLTEPLASKYVSYLEDAAQRLRRRSPELIHSA